MQTAVRIVDGMMKFRDEKVAIIKVPRPGKGWQP